MVEVKRPDRLKRHLEGKSDPLDAENAARAVLSIDFIGSRRCQSPALDIGASMRGPNRSSVH